MLMNKFWETVWVTEIKTLWYRLLMRVLAAISIILSLMVIEAEATSVTEGQRAEGKSYRERHTRKSWSI